MQQTLCVKRRVVRNPRWKILPVRNFVKEKESYKFEVDTVRYYLDRVIDSIGFV